MKFNKDQKKRLIFVIGTAVLAVAVIVTVCIAVGAKISKSSIRGEWENTAEKTTYLFLKKGELTARFDKADVPVIETEYSGELKGEYTLNKREKTLIITLNYFNKKLTQKYSYEIKNNTLALKNLEDAKTTVFLRNDR